MNNFRGGFGGGFGGGMQMQQLLKQAQKMQEDLAKKQEELKETVVTGTCSGGLVNVEMNGDKKILSLKISKDIVDPEDIEMLEDMIIASINDANAQIDKIKKETMGDMNGIPF